MIRTSEQITELSDALAKAQAKFGAAIKSSQNPAYRSKYADLSSVIEATLEHLNAEGVSVLQHPALEYKQTHSTVTGDISTTAFVTVTTRLQHRSGQWMESDISIPAVQRDRFDAQSVGSAITYGCRYGLQSILCVPREDDDGNKASGIGSREEAQKVADEKIAQLKANAVGKKLVKTVSAGQTEAPPPPITTLFYVWPERYSNNYAEFINIREFTAQLDEVAQEGLRQVFKPFLSKTVAKSGVTLIPAENMQALLEKLAGDAGIDVKELKTPVEVGQ